MAFPIPLQMVPRNTREELRYRLERAPEEHAEAILAAYEVLQEMQNQGLLEVARGVLTARDEILERLATNAAAPETLSAIRNVLYCQRILGSIEPEQFQTILKAIPQGIAEATAKRTSRVTIFGLIRRMMSRESLRALAAAIDLLQCVGRGLISDRTSPAANG